MEFVPRRFHAIPLATGPDRLPCGAAVRRPGPLRSPDRVPAPGGTPPGHRQAHHLPGRSPPAACCGSTSGRALPSQDRRWRPPAREHTGAHEPLPAGGTPLGMGLPTRGTHRLPGQGHRHLHRQLPKGGTADREGLRRRRVPQPAPAVRRGERVARRAAGPGRLPSSPAAGGEGPLRGTSKGDTGARREMRVGGRA